jgi:general secretion pathway protein G
MKRFRAHYRPNRGFTLIELVVVMTIIAILAGAISLRLTNQARNARRARAVQDIATIETAVDLYTADNGAPPDTQQGLEALRRNPTVPPVPKNWNGPYIKKLSRDPWGQPYVYRSPGQLNPDGYDIISYGEDEKPGGADEFSADITNAEEE